MFTRGVARGRERGTYVPMHQTERDLGGARLRMKINTLNNFIPNKQEDTHLKVYPQAQNYLAT